MKKNLWKRVMAAGLAAAMTLSIAGCGKKVNSTADDPKNAKEFVFDYKNYDLNISNGDNYYEVSCVESSGSKTFAVATTYDYETGKNICYIIDINTDNGSTSASILEGPDFGDSIEDVVAEDYWENMYYDGFCALDDIIVGVCNYSSSYSSPSGEYVGNDTNFICGWDYNGKFLWSVDTNDLFKADYLYLNNGFVANDQYYTMASGTTASGQEIRAVFSVDKNGKVGQKNDVAANTNLSRVLPLRDGRYVAFYYDNEYNNKAAYYDMATGNVGDEVVIPESVFTNGYNCIKAGFDSDFVYSNSQGIFKFNVGDTESTKLMDPINSDLNGYNVSKFAFIDKDHFVGSYSNLETYGSDVAMFTYVDPSTIPDKKIISMAVYYLSSDVRKRIIDFNKTSDLYRIVVEDYSQYSTMDDWTAGYTKLNNDILAGKVPAIMLMSPDTGVDFDSFAKKGLLADIDELIKKDPELSQYSYLENVFDAFAINGKHYMVVPSFNYNTYMASTKIVGNKSSLTIDEFIDLMNNADPGSKPYEYTSQSQFLNLVMSYDGREFIDLNTKKCEFNSPEFIKLVEYAAKLPEEASYDEDFYENYYDNYRSGKVMFCDMYIYEAGTYQNQKYNMYFGDGTLIGFPTKENQPGIISSGGLSFTITNSKNIDGAWEFARYYLTPEYQESMGGYNIPILQSSFDKWIEKGMERPYWEDENGIKNYYDNTYTVDGIEKVIPVMTQEDADYLRNILTSCTKSSYNNEQIMSIIEEECSACFAGQKSAADVCAIIQSRVQLYINENN